MHHHQAETAGFISDLLAGSLPRPAYESMVIQHWHIYQVLEQAAEAMRQQPVAGGFVFDELTRLPALRADLAHLLGPDWLERVSPSPATAAYCQRLREVCFGWPAGFMAFYAFPDIGSPSAFKRRYRDQLDQLPYPPVELERLVTEVQLAYRLNSQVFAELAREARSDPFSPEVVAQVMQHMNADHADDSLLIVRALGGQPAAVAVRMTGLDTTGIEFAATVDGADHPVRVAFSRPLSARAELRREVVRLYRRACAILGVAPRT